VIAAGTLAGATIASGSTTTPDLTVKQSVAKATVARGGIVTFTSYGLNLGPGNSQLDVTISGSLGLTVTDQTCQDISPDTPSCEWSSVRPDVAKKMVVKARATGPAGSHGVLTVCTSNETGASDSNPLDDCSSTFVKITR
jgi:hypothetical protein